MTDDITSIDSSGVRLYIYGYNQSVVRQSLNAAYGDVYVPITLTQNNKWVRFSVLIQPTAADVGEVAVVPMLTRNGRVWFS